MGKTLKEIEKENINKIRIGACVELTLLLNNFDSDFERMKDFINNNSNLLNNQLDSTLISQLEHIQLVLDNLSDIILVDIDKNEEYCEYHSKYY